MDNVLEALKRMAEYRFEEYGVDRDDGTSFDEDYAIIEQAILELKAIKDTDSSEVIKRYKNEKILYTKALGYLETIYSLAINECDENSPELKRVIEPRYSIIKEALQHLESIDNVKSNKALECLEEMAKYRIEYNEYSMPIKDISEYKTIKEALIKTQELEKENEELLCALMLFKQKLEDTDNIKVATTMMKQLDTNIKLEKENTEYKNILKIIKEKCLYNDNLGWMVACINYDDYKEKMSNKHDTKVVKINWNDKVVLDCLKLLTQEEFDALKRWNNGKVYSN